MARRKPSAACCPLIYPCARQSSIGLPHARSQSSLQSRRFRELNASELCPENAVHGYVDCTLNSPKKKIHAHGQVMSLEG